MKTLPYISLWRTCLVPIVIRVLVFVTFCGSWRWDELRASVDLHQAIQQGDDALWRRAVEDGQSLQERDSDGNTPLHLAALWGNTGCVDELLAVGVEVNVVNEVGATPLLYGITDVGVVRALLHSGADPNIASKLGMTPLLAAVTCGRSYEITTLLLAAGADVHVNREGPWDGGALYRAIQSGDPRTIDLLFQKGVRIEAYGKSYSPLHMASMVGDLSTVKRLVEGGADINYFDPGWDDAPGHALNWAMWGEHHDVASYLIDQGADVAFAPSIGTQTPPIVWAGFGQSLNPRIAKKLVAMGLDINTKNARGETALSYALKNGERTELVRFLRTAGAREDIQKKRKAVPSRELPRGDDSRKALTRDAVQRAVDLMQASSERFLSRRNSCVSCHHQLLPAMAFGMARERGLKVDETQLGRQLVAQIEGARENVRYGSLELVYGGFNGGKGLFALHALGYHEEEVVWPEARFLRETQNFDGLWRSFGRAPMDEPCGIQQTAWAIGGLRLFPRIAKHHATIRSLERAMHVLRSETPLTVTQWNTQLLGLHWGGESSRQLQIHVQALLKRQRPDGGWAQLPTLESDAWATGQTLYALKQAGAVAPDYPAYQRGVDFLLKTQFEDGSWWVQTRAWPFQPHFDSGFPHGRDQWISIAGTAWATMALLSTMPKVVSPSELRSGQALIELWERTLQAGKENPQRKPDRRTEPSIRFQEQIRPIFERSCLGCHSGERPKGGFRITSREHLMLGGHSGESPMRVGSGERSSLVKYVRGQIEDLEMPPLHKRDRYAALSLDEIEALVSWIDEGAEWPDGVVLNVE